ncbi:hypothetical protein RFI_14934 [Reticulomyxa filosa]|uniref:Uncharacterized protein n=1 Tax=Reticulomyxa filosa TaxID=46433 RepID=X6N7J8_RETFI|nr:hypothetical protein RFI_14934 [Reticulomyxa filosa]|eukprot:ETO22265.1 hypothetical protein RFI_14934 [Reticulomyxa filosa]
MQSLSTPCHFLSVDNNVISSTTWELSSVSPTATPPRPVSSSSDTKTRSLRKPYHTIRLLNLSTEFVYVLDSKINDTGSEKQTITSKDKKLEENTTQEREYISPTHFNLTTPPKEHVLHTPSGDNKRSIRKPRKSLTCTNSNRDSVLTFHMPKSSNECTENRNTNNKSVKASIGMSDNNDLNSEGTEMTELSLHSSTEGNEKETKVLKAKDLVRISCKSVSKMAKKFSVYEIVSVNANVAMDDYAQYSEVSSQLRSLQLQNAEMYLRIDELTSERNYLVELLRTLQQIVQDAKHCSDVNNHDLPSFCLALENVLSLFVALSQKGWRVFLCWKHCLHLFTLFEQKPVYKYRTSGISCLINCGVSIYFFTIIPPFFSKVLCVITFQKYTLLQKN